MKANLVGSHGGSLNFDNAALATSTVVANLVNVANKVSYVINGKFYAATLINNQALTAGHTAFANNHAAVFALWADTAGAYSTTQGEIVDSKEVEDGKRSLPLPDVVTTKALIGLVKVKAGVGATFTPGTTAFNATNVNTTFVNTFTMPASPFTDTVTAA